MKRWWLVPVTAGLLALAASMLPYLTNPRANRIYYEVVDANLEISATFNQDIATALLDEAPCEVIQSRTVVCVVPYEETTRFMGTIYVENTNGVQGKLKLEEQKMHDEAS